VSVTDQEAGLDAVPRRCVEMVILVQVSFDTFGSLLTLLGLF